MLCCRQQAQATEERLTTAMQTDALDLESLDSLAFRPSLMESNRVSAVAYVLLLLSVMLCMILCVFVLVVVR